jgi:hypothetical protein
MTRSTAIAGTARNRARTTIQTDSFLIALSSCEIFVDAGGMVLSREFWEEGGPPM